MNSYKKTKSLQERKLESDRILSKYMNYIPVITEKYDDKSEELDKKKYLVPDDLTFGQFIYIIRKRLKLSPEKGMFFFINKTIPNISSNMYTLYEQYKDEDNFLYVKYSTEESVFG